jgi:2'-phosphotransferase
LVNPDDATQWRIRATQGHSIALGEDAGLLTAITAEKAPKAIIHGTYFSSWPAILEDGGLRPMGRTHVHFATGVPEDGEVVSGMRSSVEVLVYVNVAKALADGSGLRWWTSENGVVLTEGNEDGLVPMAVWERVVGRRGDVGTIWEQGKGVVADVPERLIRGSRGVKGRRVKAGKAGKAEKGRGWRRSIDAQEYDGAEVREGRRETEAEAEAGAEAGAEADDDDDSTGESVEDEA